MIRDPQVRVRARLEEAKGGYRAESQTPTLELHRPAYQTRASRTFAHVDTLFAGATMALCTGLIGWYVLTEPMDPYAWGLLGAFGIMFALLTLVSFGKALRGMARDSRLHHGVRDERLDRAIDVRVDDAGVTTEPRDDERGAWDGRAHPAEIGAVLAGPSGAYHRVRIEVNAVPVTLLDGIESEAEAERLADRVRETLAHAPRS